MRVTLIAFVATLVLLDGGRAAEACSCVHDPGTSTAALTRELANAPFEHAERTLEVLERIAPGHRPDEITAAAQRDTSNNVAPGLSKEGVCMAEGRALAGAAPVRVGKSGPTVKRLRGEPPRFDDLPRGSRVRPGPWMGEILIGTDGRVVQVWPLREIEVDPPLPSYNETIRTAVRRWTYTTPTLNGTPTPACMTVTVTIDWQ